jgi:ketosteroid isomerase-like protein
MNHEQTVKDLYAAFQRGDMPAILAVVADDVDWRNDQVESRECPWNGDFSGKSRLPGFFQVLAQELDFKVFDARTFLAAGAHVAVQLRIESVVKRTGRPLKNDVMHLWTFNGQGKVASYGVAGLTAVVLPAPVMAVLALAAGVIV